MIGFTKKKSNLEGSKFVFLHNLERHVNYTFSHPLLLLKPPLHFLLINFTFSKTVKYRAENECHEQKGGTN